MHLSMRQKQIHRHREQTWLLRGTGGKGQTGGLELAATSYYIQNGLKRSYCAAQSPVTNHNRK